MDGGLAPFLVSENEELTTAFENAGIVNVSPTTAAKRELGANTPWQGVPQGSLRKLTHFRAPGMGDPMWSGACVYDLAGASPAVSFYDQRDANRKDDGLTRQLKGGTLTERTEAPPGELTSTREARVGAVYDSAPAAQFFQGFANLHWSGFLAGFVKTPTPAMHQNFNPGQMGTKELHKATQYRPVPPMGSIVGYFGSSEKAL